jgi:hypothetical protein
MRPAWGLAPTRDAGRPRTLRGMAARRLLIVLIILLVISTIAAFLAPGPGNDARPPATIGSTTTTTATAREPAPSGRLIRASIDADADSPQTVRLRLGDQLSLRVSSRASDQLEIVGLGLVEAVDRDAPALFDVFADRPGSYPVLLLRADKTVGTIKIEGRG